MLPCVGQERGLGRGGGPGRCRSCPRDDVIAIELCSPSRTDNEQTTNEHYEDDYDTEPWPGSDSDSEPDTDAKSNNTDNESDAPAWE